MTRKIYYLKSSGDVLVNIKYNHVRPVDFEKDYSDLKSLNMYEKDAIGQMVFMAGEFEQDFAVSGVQYRVNPETKELEFSYPDPNVPEDPQPYQKPLSQEVKDLRMEVARSNTEMFEMMIMMSGGGM